METLVGVLDKESIRHGGNSKIKSYKRLKHNIWREEIKEMMYSGSLSRKKKGGGFESQIEKDGVFDLISIDAYFTRR